MMRLVELSSQEAKQHFLKGSSYFNGDMPEYISFDPILKDVDKVLKGKDYLGFKVNNNNPRNLQNVNYNFISNKDGRFAWRPLELMHPAIYVSLINVICAPDKWNLITQRFSEFEGGAVDCCSAPVMSVDNQTDVATQIQSWWQRVEQQSISYSLEFSHVLHTDVTDCYGSLYTHSISWALHGIEHAKRNRRKRSLIGNEIDDHIQAGRSGQTNGISQGSVLMDFIAEIVLGFVDKKIYENLGEPRDFKILRYRDDYRIFTNSDYKAEEILKIISDELRSVGMRLGNSKTFMSRNVIEGSIKPDKLAGINLQDLGSANAKTVQKQLLRLHAFGQNFPNSGALRRLVSDFHIELSKLTEKPEDLEVQVAIATDIAVVSPSTFSVIAAILSHLISLSSANEKPKLWEKVLKKMKRVPHNGYLEIWLQRVTQPRAVGMNMTFFSNEPICQIVNREEVELWKNTWIGSNELKTALDVSKIVIGSVDEAEEVVSPEEVALFRKNAQAY
ncbi:RNA-directed DNA polymerase [Sodalinema gerasimenkoae]|uniref:RNA-directed DNA polymerase n=1 Tax=Sodalinema gerasimenkoae TaxID=2862348 RepID=UPI00135CEE31|nr:RNA-directed DNA polymerase [Sodalinema gerasimenkoae]